MQPRRHPEAPQGRRISRAPPENWVSQSASQLARRESRVPTTNDQRLRFQHDLPKHLALLHALVRRPRILQGEGGVHHWLELAAENVRSEERRVGKECRLWWL